MYKCSGRGGTGLTPQKTFKNRYAALESRVNDRSHAFKVASGIAGQRSRLFLRALSPRVVEVFGIIRPSFYP